MKRLILFILVIVGLSLASCEKEDTWEPKQTVEEDTTNWRNQYPDGGTLPTGSGTPQNALVGTNWILTKVHINGFASTFKNDTIHFITNDRYTINSNAIQLNYSYYQSMSNNATLTLYNFMPVNGWSVSTQIGPTFIDYGEITGATFEDLFNYENEFLGWFIKI